MVVARHRKMDFRWTFQGKKKARPRSFYLKLFCYGVSLKRRGIYFLYLVNIAEK
jgi:hypothetical protein